MFKFLNQMKDFLADRPEAALAALSITACLYLHRALIKEKDAHLHTVVAWMPLVERMQTLFASAVSKARSRKTSPPVSPNTPDPDRGD